LLALFFVSCNEESNITFPVDQTNIEEPNWIAIPGFENLSLEKSFTVGKTIYGNQESLLEINRGYACGPHGWVSITANARFQRYSFFGQRYVTMTVNDRFGTSIFNPSVTLTKPVIYNLTITGMDLRKIDPDEVRFVYMGPDGKYYDVKYESLFVEKQSGKLQVINAELEHFSRYGFTN
jgi:hypothetical protein